MTYSVLAKKRKMSSSGRNVKQRIARVERLIKTTELKTKLNTYNATISVGNIGILDVANIAAGALEFNRVGNQICIKSVEVRGTFDVGTAGSGSNCTLYLVTPADNNVPTAASFNQVPGGHVLQNYGRELKCFQNALNIVNPVYMKWKPKYPHIISYRSDILSDGFRNRIFLVIANFSVSTANIRPLLSVKVTFTDY